MGKLVVSEFITVDGVIEDPGGAEGFAQGGWAFQFSRGPEGDQFKLDEVNAADAMLLGRVTYEGFARVWPAVQDEVGFADKMNGMPKYVVSTTLDTAEWNNSTLIRDDVAGAVGRLKRELSVDILVAGSATLVQTLMQHDLVDEYRLMVFPVVLGSGRRLFTAAPAKLRLLDTGRAGECLVLTYEPARAEVDAAGAARPAGAGRHA